MYYLNNYCDCATIRWIMPERLRSNTGRRTNITTRVKQFRGVQGVPVQEVADGRQFADKFQRELYKLKLISCTTCQRQKLITSNQSPIFWRFRLNISKFIAINNLDVARVPNESTDLTTVEQLLIARVHPTMRIYQVQACGQSDQFHYNH